MRSARGLWKVITLKSLQWWRLQLKLYFFFHLNYNNYEIKESTIAQDASHILSNNTTESRYHLHSQKNYIWLGLSVFSKYILITYCLARWESNPGHGAHSMKPYQPSIQIPLGKRAWFINQKSQLTCSLQYYKSFLHFFP